MVDKEVKTVDNQDKTVDNQDKTVDKQGKTVDIRTTHKKTRNPIRRQLV
jgi:hypothetical protein